MSYTVFDIAAVFGSLAVLAYPPMVMGIAWSDILSMDNALPIAFVSYVLLRRMHIFRYVRHFVPCAAVGLLCYRAIYLPDDRTTILEATHLMLLKIFGQHNGKTLEDVVGVVLLFTLAHACSCLLSTNLVHAKTDIMSYFYNLVKNIPAVKDKVDSEKMKLEADIDKELKLKSRIGTSFNKLPKHGHSHDYILSLMENAVEKENLKWSEGRVSGAVYHGGKEHQELLNAAFGLYSLANPLHPDIWPSSMKYESEIISMTANLMHDGSIDTLCGCTTSGGTESIILAIKAHRDYYRDVYGITAPEIIACTSAHAACEKACDMLCIKLIKVPMTASYQMDLGATERAISPNTIMLYGSAPQFPQGIIDDISALSNLAVRYKVGLHVDMCLGGFVLPFAKKAGFDIPEFDFTLPGVTSMSVDTHKYGYALKGTSVVLYRNKELRQAQYFCYPEWTGGMYTTPTIAGSRSTGLIAQCWASMIAMGEKGYTSHAVDIMNATRKIAAGVNKMKSLEVMGHTDAMIVCFHSVDPSVNVYTVCDLMAKKGWSLNSLQNPPGCHITITVRHVGRENAFLKDLHSVVEDIKHNPSGHLSGNAAIYGMASSLPSGPVTELLKTYNDVVYKL